MIDFNRTIVFEFIILAIQWMLMIAGLGLLSLVIAPTLLVPPTIPNDRYVDAMVKALVALIMSVFWLFIWDRQVRFLFYRKNG